MYLRVYRKNTATTETDGRIASDGPLYAGEDSDFTN